MKPKAYREACIKRAEIRAMKAVNNSGRDWTVDDSIEYRHILRNLSTEEIEGE